MIRDYSSKFFLINDDDEKKFVDLIKKYNGKYFPKLKGWLILNKYKDEFKDNVGNAEINKIVKKIIEDNEDSRPVYKEKKDIKLYTTINFMSVAFTKNKLFYLDDKYWDSVERYLMYKMYEGTAKSDAIEKASNIESARRLFKKAS